MNSNKFALYTCRRTHQPSSDLWSVSGEEGVAHQGCFVHGGTVLGCDMRLWFGEGLPKVLLQSLWRRSQRAAGRVQQGHWIGC